MESNELDRNARGRLSRHESQMDVDAFWNQLEPRLPKDKSRPKLLILLFAMGLLACLAVVGLNLVVHKTHGKGNSIVAQHDSLGLEFDKILCDSIESSLLTVNRKLREEDSISNPSDSHNGNYMAFSPKSSTTYTGKESTNQVESKKEQVRHKPVSMVEGKGIYSSEAKTKVKQEISKNKTSSISITNPGNNNFISNSDSQSSNAASIIAKLQSEAQPGKPFAEMLTDSMIGREFKTAVNTLSEQNSVAGVIQMLPVDIHTVKSNITLLELKPVLIPEIESVVQKKYSSTGKLTFHLMPAAGIGFYTKRLHNVENSALNNYVAIRNLAESNLEEWFMSLLVKWSYKKAGIVGGIEYIRRNERFSYLSMKEEHQFGTTEIRIEEGDSIHYISGSGWYGTTQLRKVVHYNSIQQWNVPLGLNYAVSISGVKFDCSAGALFSISNKIEGKTFDTSLNIADWGQSKDLNYKSSLGLGWFADLSCAIPLRKSIVFNTGFRIQEFPQNYLDRPLTLHYRSYLWKAGFIFKLF